VRLLSDVYSRGSGSMVISALHQTIRLDAAIGGIVHVAFARKPPRSVLKDMRGMGTWNWTYRRWSIDGTTKQLARFFKALAQYLDELTREGSVELSGYPDPDAKEYWKI